MAINKQQHRDETPDISSPREKKGDGGFIKDRGHLLT